MRSSKYTEHYTDTFITFKEIMRTVSNIYHNCVPDKIKNRRNTDQLKQRDTVIIACVIWGIINGYTGMATVFLTNFIRCRTSFRMLFRLSLTMSLLGCDDLRQELTVKVRLPR
ncbi:transposase [Enterococcus faecium]|nr:transposase [Enterococcus faecium]VFA46992.1 transposase [Enterococcus faecium]